MPLVSHYNTFSTVNFTWHHILYIYTQYIDKTYSVKQMCASVLLKLNIKLFFGIKHITPIKRYAMYNDSSGRYHEPRHELYYTGYTVIV